MVLLAITLQRSSQWLRFNSRVCLPLVFSWNGKGQCLKQDENDLNLAKNK